MKLERKFNFNLMAEVKSFVNNRNRKFLLGTNVT